MPHFDSAQPRFTGVRRIAALRGGGLGDVIFALPSLEALQAAYPEARITLLGSELHAKLFAGRPGPVAAVETLPHLEGIRSGKPDKAATADFLARMNAAEFDLAVQLHGGGRNSNPLLLSLGARHTVGSATPDAAELERTLPYRFYQHEVIRALEVAGLAGAPVVTLTPRLQVVDDDVAAAEQALAGLSLRGNGPLLALHPGASDPRRHWPAACFARVAARAAEHGCEVVVVGDESERGLADSVVKAASSNRVHSAAGRLTLSGLVGLLARSTAFVGNDSGPRHVAQALGTPTVGVYWVGNALTAAPLERAYHRVALGWVTACPICGNDVTQIGWTTTDCGHDFCAVADVRVEDVWTELASLLRSRRLTC